MLSPSPTRIVLLFVSISITLNITFQVRAFQTPSQSFRIDSFTRRRCVKGKVHSKNNLNISKLNSNIGRSRLNLWNRDEGTTQHLGLNKLRSNIVLGLGKTSNRREWIAGSLNGRRRRTARRALSFLSSLSLSGSSESNNNGSSTAGTKASVSEKIARLEAENKKLQEDIQKLEDSNRLLALEAAQGQKIVVEQFEGEGMPTFNANGNPMEGTWWEEGREDSDINFDNAMVGSEECDEDDDGTDL